MSRRSQFSSLIPLIYDAPFTDAGWQTVMEVLTTVFDSQWMQMHAANAIDKGTDFSAIHPLDENTGRAYLEHYINIDPRAPFLVKRDNIVRIRKDIVSDDIFYKSEIYNDFLKPNEAEQTLLTPIEGLSDGVNFIVLMRSNGVRIGRRIPPELKYARGKQTTLGGRWYGSSVPVTGSDRAEGGHEVSSRIEPFGNVGK